MGREKENRNLNFPVCAGMGISIMARSQDTPPRSYSSRTLGVANLTASPTPSTDDLRLHASTMGVTAHGSPLYALQTYAYIYINTVHMPSRLQGTCVSHLSSRQRGNMSERHSQTGGDTIVRVYAIWATTWVFRSPYLDRK
jgi:hypothetical protein